MLEENRELYEVGNTGKCPHCGNETKFINVGTRPGGAAAVDMGFPGSPQIQNFAGVTLLSGKSYVAIRASSCFICNGIVVWLWGSGQDEAVQEFRAWPLGSERPVSVEVPDNIASIFKRASRQLGIDSVASAAFSRTCLEKLLDDQSIPRIGDNNRSLNLQNRIQAFMKSKQLSQELSANVDILREMGNFIHLNESLLRWTPLLRQHEG